MLPNRRPEPGSHSAGRGVVVRGAGEGSVLVDQFQEHISVTGQATRTDATEIKAPKLAPRFGQ